MSDTRVASIPAMPQEELAKHIRISEDFYTEFANHVRIAMSETDIRIFWGESYPKATGEVVVIEKLSIALAPQHAKLFLGTLAQIIDGYEKLFGPVKPPTSIPVGTSVEQLTQEKTSLEPK